MHMQTALKRSWTRLARSPIKGTYSTDVARWTCNCGAQKYHAYLLCKHLVQAAGPIPDVWWREATRYHIPPFFTVPVDGIIADAPESVWDYGWLERMGLEAPEVMQKSAGGENLDKSLLEGTQVCNMSWTVDMSYLTLLMCSYNLLHRSRLPWDETACCERVQAAARASRYVSTLSKRRLV